MTLHVSESGDSIAPTIVFLHGAGTGGWMWMQQVADFSDFHTLNIELPGHGGSSAVEWVSLSDTADKVAAVIRERAHHGRAHLVGLSLGGYSALKVIEKYPALVGRAVVSGVTDSPLSLSLMLNLQMRVMTRLARYRWFVRIQAKYMMQLPADAVELYTDSAMKLSRETYDAIQNEILDYRLPDALSGSTVPTLIVAGGAEMAAIREAVGRIPVAMPSASGMIAPDLHHGWNGENPELFSAMIRAWITNAPLPSALQPV